MATGALIILEMLLFLASFDRTYVLIVCRETQEVVAETEKYVNRINKVSNCSKCHPNHNAERCFLEKEVAKFTGVKVRYTFKKKQKQMLTLFLHCIYKRENIWP